MNTQLFDAARSWAAQDPDAETRDELLALIEAGDVAALESRMGSRLDFGTAGLRGELGAGPNRMNRVLVAQAAAGIRDYVNEHFKNDASVVIGFDGRIISEAPEAIVDVAGKAREINLRVVRNQGVLQGRCVGLRAITLLWTGCSRGL